MGFDRANFADRAVLFAFDPATRAVLLVAGDKAGDWKRWYVRAVTLAEHRYEQWIKEARS
ncbi:MAG TPA: type II toxin-antitoxin system RelE/ParE family toxin [Pseudonocardiaceae bacterium]|nr:type II toxin-antitoxin system RelE/ParE family toxin [Pseudonocardiaceae bacterium]